MRTKTAPVTFTVREVALLAAIAAQSDPALFDAESVRALIYKAKALMAADVVHIEVTR